jgi:SSS family solute:Na+ symporter
MSTILTFLFFTGLVGFITYLRTHNDNLQNSLNGWVIAGSLMLTNLSAANFTGMTGNVYAGNLSPIAWTVTVIPVLIYFSAVLLPTFLRGGFATIPEFLENRFGKSTRRLIAVMFLLSYILSAMPVSLYGGSIALNLLFDVSGQSGLSHVTVVWILVWSMGTIGSLYALFGGLRGVAISDTLNGIGLLLGGAMVFIIGIYKVGQNSLTEGFQIILTKNTQILDAVGDVADGIPFSVLFTGMLIHNLFFWSTNQFIVQRTLGARSLKEGQKGVMIAAFFKIINVCYIAMPGVIAYHLYGPDNFENKDWVYPTLIRDIMPNMFVGFFAAVLFGAVLSTFNSVLNSSVTIFALDVYKPIFGKDLTDNQVIQRSKRFGVAMAVTTMFIAPFIMYFPDGIFNFMTRVDSLFGAPIMMAMLLGYFSKTVSTKVVNLCIILFLAVYSTLMLVIKPDLHYLHYLAIFFVSFIALALIIGKFSNHKKEPIQFKDLEGVDTTPWKHFKLVAVLAMSAMVGVYFFLSPWGIVESDRIKTIETGKILAGLVMAFVLFGLPLMRKRLSTQ